MRSARAAAIAVTLLATVAVPPARSATIDTLRSGWWTAGAAPSLPASVAHPTVPAGGLDVADNFTGPYSIAAVHIPEPGSPQDAILTLTLAKGATPGVAVVACPTTSRWTPASGGRLADAPRWDCARSAPGVIAPDGVTIAWTVPASFARQGAIDVALVPSATASPFDAPLSAVKPTSVTFSSGPPPSRADSVSSGVPAAGEPAGPSGGQADSVPAPSDSGALPPAGAVTALDAQPSAPAAQALPTPGAPVPATPAAAPPHPERAAIRLEFSLLLTLLVGAAVVALTRAARSTNPPSAEVRGVGRFATTHDAPPRPL